MAQVIIGVDPHKLSATVKRNVLAAVNARFGLGLPLPFSTEAPPGTPFEVVTVRR
jgi:hypothetical protein